MMAGFLACRKNGGQAKAVSSFTIKAITLDSAYQVTNPMSFFITLVSNDTSYRTTDYWEWISNSAWYPTGVWTDLRYRFLTRSVIILKLYFKVPGIDQAYEEANSTFYLTPDDYGRTNPAYPPQITLIGKPGDPNSTKITLTVSWE